MVKTPVEEKLEAALSEIGHSINDREYANHMLARSNFAKDLGKNTGRVDYTPFLDRSGRPRYIFVRFSEPVERDEIVIAYGVGDGNTHTEAEETIANRVIERGWYSERIVLRRRLNENKWIEVGRVDIKRLADPEYMSAREINAIVEHGSSIYVSGRETTNQLQEEFGNIMLGPRVKQERERVREICMPFITTGILGKINGMPADERGADILASTMQKFFVLALQEESLGNGDEAEKAAE